MDRRARVPHESRRRIETKLERARFHESAVFEYVRMAGKAFAARQRNFTSTGYDRIARVARAGMETGAGNFPDAWSSPILQSRRIRHDWPTAKAGRADRMDL